MLVRVLGSGVKIDVDTFELVLGLSVHVDEPVGSLRGVGTSLGLLKDLVLLNLLDGDVVVLAPDLLKTVVDIRIVMAAVGVAVVDANRVQVVLHLLKVFLRVRLLNLGLEVKHLLLHLLHLTRQLAVIIFERVDDVGSLLLCLVSHLIYERVVRLYLGMGVLPSHPVFEGGWLLRRLQVHREELLDEFEHRAEVVVGLPEVGVLEDALFQELDIFFHGLHLVLDLINLIFVLGHKTVDDHFLLDLHLMLVLHQLSVLELQPVQLQAHYFRCYFDELGLHGSSILRLRFNSLSVLWLEGVLLDMEIIYETHQLLLPGVVDIFEPYHADKDGCKCVGHLLTDPVGAFVVLVREHLADLSLEVAGHHVVGKDYAVFAWTGERRVGDPKQFGDFVLLLGIRKVFTLFDADGAVHVDFEVFVQVIVEGHFSFAARGRRAEVYCAEGLLLDFLIALLDPVVVELLKIQAFLNATEERIIELTDVLLVAKFNGLPGVVANRLQHVGRVRILIVAEGHLPEKHLQVVDQPTRLLQTGHKQLVFLVFALRLQGWVESLSVVGKRLNSLDELREVEVHLQDGVQVAGVANVL
mmetsp:Transcript_13952/g.21746  ORF Transcript_13952/g.21746 Transcript_13952/m.21746 type:complete len:582 (-) Transcript_13952:811-2556(-)|eukprot:CAMPEP_0170484772 /NCGR_PEP_ID=MMETSP0208-20121228/4166_1 /TAXON_ID=197538 /ORGANISM="Strombidium inclinatum, Strain S3" /LENGTH=581 /DNA_ID=CAMNT_0010758203 /DNA_START=1294 /DNA_END=3039 /DNA_ORIENTATION=+